MQSYMRISCGVLAAVAAIALMGCANDDAPPPYTPRIWAPSQEKSSFRTNR